METIDEKAQLDSLIEQVKAFENSLKSSTVQEEQKVTGLYQPIPLEPSPIFIRKDEPAKDGTRTG